MREKWVLDRKKEYQVFLLSRNCEELPQLFAKGAINQLHGFFLIFLTLSYF